MAKGLATFSGVERRFQLLGEAKGVTVVDDYAHNPARWRRRSRRRGLPIRRRRVVAAFQPHLFSRTRDFAREFGTALAAADAVFLATSTRRANSRSRRDVVARRRRARRRGRDAGVAGRPHGAGRRACGAVREGDVVLTVGAGDITKTGPELLERLRR